MSETPPAPDWWQASDGRWYPPQTHPSRVGAFRPVQQPVPSGEGYPPGAPYPGGLLPSGAPAQAPDAAPPARRRGPRGCLVAAVVTLVLVVAAAVAGVALVRTAAHRVGGQVQKVAGTGSCDFLDEARAARELGRPVRIVPLGGLFSGALGALDDRALPDAPVCYAVITESGPQVARLARAVGPHAADEYARDLAKARATAPDRTSGDAVLSYHRPVRRLGTAAFCTGPDRTGSSGVLVRARAELVYVSVSPDVAAVLGEGSATALPRSPFGPAANEDSCRLATALARAVLASPVG